MLDAVAGKSLNRLYEWLSRYYGKKAFDTYGLVNIENGEFRFDSMAALCTMGFCREGHLPEIPEEVYEKVKAILEGLNGDYSTGYRQ